MKKFFTLISAAALFLAAGCDKQEFGQMESGDRQTINLTLQATRGENVQTRTAVTYNDEYASLQSVWSEGDQIYVYSRKSGKKIGVLTQEGIIVNQKASATAQYATSYAYFKGTVTPEAGDDIVNDDVAFVYQGAGRSLDVAEGLLTYEIGTCTDIAGLSAWDLAYATGKIQGTAEAASCAVSFTNKLGFGYFSTEGLSQTSLEASYYGGFTLDVKTGTITGTMGQVSLPDNQAFYMPLIAGSVNMDCGKVWSQQASKWGYSGVFQSKSFTAAAGNYYRLGRNADVPFGPVKFQASEWTLYETLKGSKFSIAADKEVYFTQGNLQYIGSAADPYWRIAPSQYSYLGNANGKPTSTDKGSKIPANTDVDLFGWGEVNPPFLGSTDNSDYQPDITTKNIPLPEAANWATKFNAPTLTKLYADKDNNIEYPKNGVKYYVLTDTEWKYLFDNQYWGFATVKMNDGSSVNGLVICPNTITTEEQAKAFLTGTVYRSSSNQTGKTSAYGENYIDQSTIDANGLLFLPAAGSRNGSSVSTPGSYGRYWSTVSSSQTYAYYVRFYTTYFYSAYSNDRYGGFSVRLASLVSE